MEDITEYLCLSGFIEWDESHSLHPSLIKHLFSVLPSY